MDAVRSRLLAIESLGPIGTHSKLDISLALSDLLGHQDLAGGFWQVLSYLCYVITEQGFKSWLAIKPFDSNRKARLAT